MVAEFGIAPNSSPLQGDANLSQLFSRKGVPPRGNAPRSIGYRPIALLLSDEGKNTFIEEMKVDMTDEPTMMSFEEALRLMRDPQTSIPRQLVAGSILHASLPNLTDDDLLTIMHRYRSVAWWAAHELHDRTGRPRILGNDGFIVIDLEGWEKYLPSSSKNRP